MTYRAPSPRIPRSVGRRVLIGIVVVVAAIILIAIFTSIMSNVLWYRSLGYGGVYGTMIGIRLLLFVLGAIVLGGTVLVNLVVAKRLRPMTVPNTADQQTLARYRRTFEPYLGKIAVVLAALVGLIGGLSLDGTWETVLGFWNRTPFGTEDPQFHLDAGFYVFTYPFIRLVIDTAFAAVVLGFFAAAITHYLFGGVRIAGRGRGRHVSAGARAHLGILLGIFMLLKAIAYWLDRYGLVHSTRGVIEGASFTDVHAVLPAKTILAVIALCCALLFFVSAFRRGMLFAGLSVGLLILSAILIGGAYPAIIQQFQVKPNQVQKESPYIARNITATRTAYGLQHVQVKPYDARSDVSQSQTSSADEAQNVRLVDPNVVSKTFQQLQQIRGFYTFNEALDVDRYDIAGQQQTSIVAVRELPAPPPDRASSWVSQHIQYTHGYGFVSADGNKVDSDGKPVWQAYNIPEQSDLGTFQPRIYFGEQVPDYSIVGGPKGAAPAEFDYASESQSGQQNTTYTGSGGVPMGSFWTRLLYALKFHDINILLSDSLNSHSHILYDRDPRQMVQKAAPYLELDGDPYPAVVDGRVQWIVDGYTTSDAYPYSERTSLDQATEDTLTATGANAALPSKQVNYMRNSVKATVDAYDGTVTLYAWDPNDPLLKTWQKAFGNKVKPASAMSADLRDHIRYPEDMFKAQREILSRYHVTNPASFYGGQDFWSVPDDPTNSAVKVAQPPYYLESRMPGDKQPTFSLTSTLVPKNRPNLAAFVSVSSDVHNGYGNIRVLQLPRDTAVPGPGTVQGNFEAYAPASTELALLRRGGSSVRFGNLLTLPFGGGLLYAEPVFVQANSGESYPLLQRVLVSFGTKIGYAPTLDEAMKQVLSANTDNKNQKNKNNKTNTGDLRSQLAKALADAQQAYADGQDALKKGDFTAYGDAQKRLKAALDRADAIQRKLGATSTVSPSPSPSASGGGTPSPSGPSPSKTP